ncbi:MAG: ABC transporter permease [Thermaerobacter sp.]|nr:ABC transporter permease [Thermaerobacter sp.]
MVVKEFRQMRRDKRTLGMMIVLPVMLLVIFGYAASFDVSKISALVVGPQAASFAKRLHAPFDPVRLAAKDGVTQAKTSLRDGQAQIVFIADKHSVRAIIDGTDLFAARAAEAAVARLASPQALLSKVLASLPPGHVLTIPASELPPKIDVLYNPGLKTAVVMVPGLAGIILVFIGTLVASLGVVRERQAGTLEQLAVMPLSPWDVLIGKIVPYFLVAALDLSIVLGAGMLLFDVPMRGSVLLLILGALLFLFVTLSLGVLISSVSENQGQAIQLAMMTILPQILLSGLIFPLSSMAIGVRWIAYVLPLTYFIEIARGVMLKGTPISDLWQPFLFLGLLGAVAVTLATLRFRRLLSPSPRRNGRPRAGTAS